MCHSQEGLKSWKQEAQPGDKVCMNGRSAQNNRIREREYGSNIFVL